MPEIEITFPDGSKKKFQKGITAMQIAEGISKGLAKQAVAAKVNGKLFDLGRAIEANAKIEILKFEGPESKDVFWHSTNHVLAQAVSELFPKAKLTIGPSIEEGFFYDFDVPTPFTPEDLVKIEAKMGEIISKDEKFQRTEIDKKEALKKCKGNEYKCEIIEGIPDEKVSFYKQNGFEDLCEGPHLFSTGMIKGLKLMRTAGAYWRGDSKNKMLQRIYGISFPEKKQMDDYLHVKEEAEKRNHIKLGKELDLYSIQYEAPGCIFFHPKGMAVWNSLTEFARKEQFRRGYREVNTPLIMKKDLWLKSGHWDHYKNNMYFTKIDEADFAVKPMNCPGHILIYKNKRHSYRDLPLRISEFGTVHRHELSGVLNGLVRVRKFTQDDAHIFCTEDQIKEEVKGVVSLVDFYYKTFGFSYHVELSTRPENAMGSIEVWDKAEKALDEALKEMKMDYKLNPGDGAFYGPKIDFHIKDAIGRTWQCATVQLDFSMPEKFELGYIGSDDKEHRPVMIHRAIFGSIERFIGVLIEHYGGAFPLWLSPEQARVIPIGEKFIDYANEVHRKLLENGIRAEIDMRNETIGHKIREAQLQKVNYMVVVGEKEVASGTLNVRNRKGEQRPEVKLEAFIEELKEEIELREKNSD